MGRIPVRLDRVAAAFLEAARTAESSGSEHSPEGFSADLSELVNSFIQRDVSANGARETENGFEEWESCDRSESDVKESLENLLSTENDSEPKEEILSATEIARRIAGDRFSPDFKRRLMSRLRDNGFDAGLCKSRWEKLGRHPAGRYEYVDVNVSGTRYIVEVNLAGEFEIARPTAEYASLLEIFPEIFVGKAEELKQIARLMCSAMRRSMKSADMHVPPWRRKGYVQAKWSGPYRRTINDETAVAKKGSSKNNSDVAGRKISVGSNFKAQGKKISGYNCTDGFSGRLGLKVGNLSAALNSNEIDMKG